MPKAPKRKSLKGQAKRLQKPSIFSSNVRLTNQEEARWPLSSVTSMAQERIFKGLDSRSKEFLEFVLSKYIETGVEELGEEKLPDLLSLKYRSIADAENILGGVSRIRTTFFDFQKHLYANVSSSQ